MMLRVINVTVRVDENIKKQTEQVLDELGMTMSTAINLYVRAIARERRIPFEITLGEPDPFFNQANLNRIAMSKKQIADGNVIYKASEELGLDDE